MSLTSEFIEMVESQPERREQRKYNQGLIAGLVVGLVVVIGVGLYQHNRIQALQRDFDTRCENFVNWWSQPESDMWWRVCTRRNGPSEDHSYDFESPRAEFWMKQGWLREEQAYDLWWSFSGEPFAPPVERPPMPAFKRADLERAEAHMARLRKMLSGR